MDDAPALDVRTDDPRALMGALLPGARRNYVKAWELLADASTPLERRRAARERATAIADDHAIVAQALRDREASLQGDDLLNARHLVSELERHADALRRIVTISPVGLHTAKELRPESLGCGRRYRDPSRDESIATKQGGRAVKQGSGSGARASDPNRERSRKRPFEDRGPKVDRGQLGTSKHDSALGDDLDEATRAKLEALRAALEE
jgi:hypothetical protein